MEKLTVDSMEKLKGTVEKCISDLAKKDDLTPAETRAALDGMQLRDALCCELDCEHEKEDMERSYGYSMRRSYSDGYSGHHSQPYRRYNITAYGRPMEYEMDRRYSGDYGVEGWYRSGDDRGSMRMSYCGPWDEGRYDPYWDYNYGRRMDGRHNYSSHSVADRIVSLIEHDVMGGNNSEYENEEAKKFIRMIRQAEMG